MKANWTPDFREEDIIKVKLFMMMNPEYLFDLVISYVERLVEEKARVVKRSNPSIQRILQLALNLEKLLSERERSTSIEKVKEN